MMHMHSPVRGSLHARVTARTVKGPSSCSHSPLGLKHGRAACVRVAAASISATTNFVNQAEQQEPRRNWSIKEFLDWWVVKSPKAPDDPPLSGSPKHSQLLRVGRKLFSLISNDTGLLFCAILFMVGAAVSELAIPHFATQCIFAAATAGAGVESYSGTLRLVTAIILAYGTASALRGFCFSLLNNRMSKRLRSQLFASLVRREMSFFDTNEVGGITSRLQSDCQAMTKCISTNLNVACRNLLQAIGGAIYLSLTSPVLCGATLGVCALLASITLAYGQYARHNQRVVQDTLAASSQVAEEALSLTRVVRAFGTEAQEQARYVGWLQRLYEVGLRQGAGYGLFVFMGHLLSYSTKVVALVLGCAMLVQGQLTAEQLVSFIFYVEFVTYASLSACDEVVEIMEAVGASERVIGWLEAPPAPQVASGICPTSFGTVELRDVSFRYPTRPNQATLSNINLKLERGQLVALVGASGSGKSTVVALLQRLYDPTAGAVLVDGQDLRTLDAAWYRSQIGVVSQEPRLFGTTIALNIAYGCSATQEEIEDAARQANAHAFIMSLPKGYDTHVTDRLLSGGQKQRIALARALVRKPRLLILDEATSALDSESEAQVQAALDAAMYTRTRSSIVIAHRMSTVQKADWAVVMEAGHIVEQGPHAQLLQLGGIYSRLVLGQAGREMLAERPEPRPTDGPEPVSSRSREEFLSLDGVDMSDTENELSLGSHAT